MHRKSGGSTMLKLSRPETESLDGIVEDGDKIEVRLEQGIGGLKLYVDVNGRTILRLGQIEPGSATFSICDGARTELHA
jgi:hypothetical protein